MDDSLFQKQKEQCLAGVDLSRKGSIDEAIVDVVGLINKQKSYVTTSSCSGRIALFSYSSSEIVKKKDCTWLHITHSYCASSDIISALKNCDGEVFFKFEAFVLHVQCATLDSAQILLAKAIAAGYRNSGISVGKKGKIIVAVRSTHSLEVPLTHDGKILVTNQYIEHIVNLANVRMTQNLERIHRFSENLKMVFEADKIVGSEEKRGKKVKKVKKKHGKITNTGDALSTHNEQIIETENTLSTHSEPITNTGGQITSTGDTLSTDSEKITNTGDTL